MPRLTSRSARRAFVAGVAVGVLAAPATAAAGTVSVLERTLTYVAAPGEVNRLTLTREPDAYRISDAGAPVVVGAGCASVSPNEATCAAAGIRLLRVRALDGDDLVSLAAARPAVVRGGEGDDTIAGGEGGDRLLGDEGHDTLRGGTGIDLLDGGAGGDRLSGGTGVIFPFAEAEDEEELELDFAVYERRTNGVRVDLDGAADDGEPGEGDLVGSDIEVVMGGAGDDVLVGHARANILIGRRGEDTLRGAGGSDSLHGGPGRDALEGGERTDEVSGDGGNDEVRGGPGRDNLDGGPGRDRMFGGADGDFLYALDWRRDRVNGGAGRDCAAVDRRLDVVRRVECLARPHEEGPPERLTGARRPLAATPD